MMNTIFQNVFQSLEEANVTYCLLRDCDQLERLTNPGEVDLLISPDELKRVGESLAVLGFVRLPNWGHKPHYFFLTYDEASDAWIKLDFVTEIAYGTPIRSLRTTLAQNCLVRRQRSGSIFILSPEDELVTLILHCILDKKRFTEERRDQLQSLRDQVTEDAYLTTLLASNWSAEMGWRRLASLIDGEKWTTLLAERERITNYLSNRDQFGTFVRQVTGRLLRKLNRWTGTRYPHAPTVALLAPDGAGKSTLATSVGKSYYFPVRTIYMGLYQNEGLGSKGIKFPGLGLARRVFRQWRRYLSGRLHQTQGRLVIFDRYCYDALLPRRQPLGRAGKVRRWLLGHACPAPDLVVVLDAPGETLFARKGEHSAAVLEEQRQNYLQLRSHIPQLLVVDATRNAETVRREVIGLIWRDCARQSMPAISR
jgi:hypothetical protein